MVVVAASSPAPVPPEIQAKIPGIKKKSIIQTGAEKCAFTKALVLSMLLGCTSSVLKRKRYYQKTHDLDCHLALSRVADIN